MSKFGGYEEQLFIAEFYDYDPNYRTRSDKDFYLSLSQSAEGKTLELGCGTGRILVPIAEAGCHIVGLDLSDYMLAKCREKLDASHDKSLPGRVRLVKGTITNFDLEQSFDLATTPFRVFQHLVSIEDQLACLQCVNKHLHLGGKLVLDLFQVNLDYLCNPDRTKETEDFSGVEIKDGRKLRRTHRLANLHRVEQYNDVELIYYVTHPNGREERLVHSFPFRYFFRYEVEHILQRCGFNTLDVFGNYDKSPLRDDSPEMVFLAEKVKHLDK